MRVMAINSHASSYSRVKILQNGTRTLHLPIDLLISTHIPHSNISFERKLLSIDEKSIDAFRFTHMRRIYYR